LSDHPSPQTAVNQDPLARWVILRLCSLADEDPFDFADEQERSAKDQGVARAWSIMVIDDDDEVHRAIDLALSGIDVLGRPLRINHCRSAASARSRLLEGSDEVDLVLLDVVMETVDAGLHLLEELRNLPATRDLPVLLHTGQPGQAPEHSVRSRYDISGYLTKSNVTRPMLIAALESALGAQDRQG
jgi:CheY-like chemotaxis protein